MSDEQEKQKSAYEMLCHKGIQHKDGDIIYTWEEWQEIAGAAGAEEAELARLRALAEATEKLSAEDARGIAEDLSVTLNKVPGGFIEKILAYAEALETGGERWSHHQTTIPQKICFSNYMSASMT